MRQLYQQEQLPVFQNFVYASEAEAKACPKADIRLVEDQQTGLVYNAAFKPELMIYDSNYQNEQALSPSFQQHLEIVSRIIEQRIGRVSIVEVGCGKGYFLELLLAKGFDAVGFDPAYEGDNNRINKRYFGPGDGICAGGLVLRHVLEHVESPYEFLLQLKTANGGQGTVYVEVPCFDWILARRAWFDVFFEHVNYFRMSDFFRMFERIMDCGRLFGGQYLYVVADLATLRRPNIDYQDCVTFPQDFLRSLVAKRKCASPKTAIWGSSSKGVIYALLKARVGEAASVAIDINPAKQGKYLPATGLLVQSPAVGLATLQEGSVIYVMNSNYLGEIMDMSGNSFTYVVVDHE